MRRFVMMCVVLMAVSGCGMVRGQQVARPVFGNNQPVAVNTDDNYRDRSEVRQPRESFFRRVFGRPRQQQ